MAEHESGLAAGLVDSAFHVGSALGIAIVTTVAVARTEDVLAGGGAELSAITEGFQLAFLVAIGFAVVGAMVASVFLRRGEIAAAGPAAPLATTQDIET